MEPIRWTVDGETVAGRLHMPAGSSRVPLVILGHGLSSCQDEFVDFPEKIARAGCAALTFDYRGHGASGGERGIVSKERVLADLRGALETLQSHARVDPTRVALLGHSAGGALMLCASTHLPQVRCVIALAPLARTRDEMNLFEFVGYNVARLANVPVRLFSKTGLSVPYKVDYTRLYADPHAVERARKNPFLQTTIPVKNYRSLVQDLDGAACAERVTIPALVLVAEYDIVVGKYNSRRVYEALAGPKAFHEIPRSGHSMCGDAQSDLVAAHVTKFLDQHLRGAPGA